MGRKKKQPRASLRHYVQYGAIRAGLAVFSLLPYRSRLSATARLMARVVAPLAGYRRRTVNNLQLVFPDLPESERNGLAVRVAGNVGRMLAEILSPREFKASLASTALTGPGLPALEAARDAGRPTILISGHFGNYDAVRACLIARGFNVGGLYRRMQNPLFHRFYIDRISEIGTPLFERGRPGFAAMIRHLKSGGTLAALIDLRASGGEVLEFFGHPAWTAVSLANLALKYDALIVPCYGIRQEDGVSFEVVFEEPLEHSDPKTMTQALNDSLERRIRQNVDQWLWFHNRWQGAPQRRDAGDST